MELHLIIEILCSFLGLLLFINTKKSYLVQNTLVGLFGLFLFITGMGHIAISTFAEINHLIEFKTASPITWIFPAVFTPMWIKSISKKSVEMPPLLLAMLMVGVLLVTIGCITIQSLYWDNPIIGRPFEFIIVFFAAMSILKVYNVNGTGKPLTVISLLFMISHFTMAFSTHPYDLMFSIAHTIKLCWHIALFLLIKNNYVTRDSDKLFMELDKRLR